MTTIDDIKINTRAAFLSTFTMIASIYIDVDPDNYPKTQDGKDDFDRNVSDCIEETLEALCIQEPFDDDLGEWWGQWYDLLAENDIAQWPQGDDAEEETA